MLLVAVAIIMVNAADPVGVGLVASLARPGGNVTGLSQQLTPEIRAKQLQLLKEMLPKMSRVGVLRSAATTVGLREYEAAGQTLEVRIQVVEIRNRNDLAYAFTAMARERIDAVLVPADPFLFTERQRVAELAAADGGSNISSGSMKATDSPRAVAPARTKSPPTATIP